MRPGRVKFHADPVASDIADLIMGDIDRGGFRFRQNASTRLRISSRKSASSRSRDVHQDQRSAPSPRRARRHTLGVARPKADRISVFKSCSICISSAPAIDAGGSTSAFGVFFNAQAPKAMFS